MPEYSGSGSGRLSLVSAELLEDVLERVPPVILRSRLVMDDAVPCDDALETDEMLLADRWVSLGRSAGR